MRILIVLVVTVLAGVAGFAASWLIPPRYVAETSILIDSTHAGQAAAGQNDANRTATPTNADIAGQIEILRSTDLLTTVADRLDLANRLQSDNRGQPAFVGRLMALAGLDDGTAGSPSGNGLIPFLKNHLSVDRQGESSIVEVQYRATDNQLAADVANAVAETYLATRADAAPTPERDDLAAMEAEISTLQDRVRAAEGRLSDYRAKSGSSSTDGQRGLIARQVGDASAERGRVRAQKAEAEARATVVKDALAADGSLADLTTVVQSEVLERLRDDRTAVQSDIADLSVTLLDQHPRMKAARSQLADIDDQIRAGTERALKGLENEIRLLELREQNLTTRIDGLQAQAASAERDAAELVTLERTASVERDLLNSALRRYQAASSRSQSTAPVSADRVISAATAPDMPYFPDRSAIAAGAALAGFLLSTAFFLLTAAIGRVRTQPVSPRRDERSAAVGTTRNQVPPPAESDDDGESDPAVEDLAADLAKRRRNRVAEPAAEQQHSNDRLAGDDGAGIIDPHTDAEYSVSVVTGHLIAKSARLAIVVSPEGDKGSAASVMLARMLANDGRQTLLLDMTGSAYPSRMMVPQSRLPGITDVLVGTCTTSDAVHSDRLSDAHIMPQGTADAQTAMANAAELPAVIARLTDVYDIVVAECGPAGAEEIKPLVAEGQSAETIVSAVQPGDPLVRNCLADLRAAGFATVAVMSPGAGDPPRDPDRRAA